jgi:hypothetical protein
MIFRTDTAYRRRLAVTGLALVVGRGRSETGFGRQHNVDSISMVPACCEEDEAATEGLLPIDQWSNQEKTKGP